MREEGYQLPILQVDVVEQAVRSKAGWERCEIDQNIDFLTSYLETYCFAPWDALVYDSLLLAAAVEFCDRFKKRPALSWGREFELRVPVHHPEHWNDPKVNTALIDALNFLTGDSWNIEFYSRKEPFTPLGQTHIPLPKNINAVMAYSDGMDSRAVAGLLSNEMGNTLTLIRLGSKTCDRPQINGGKYPFTSVPFEVKSSKKSFVESSVRSRGFKFALISGLSAYLIKAGSIIIPESGQGSLAPALVPVGQAYPDYRNHPLFLQRMEKFLYALLGYQVRYQFPRLWYTKGETLKAFAEQSGEPDAWKTTWSCWQDSRRVSVNGKKRQCGVCAACMLRRLSIHAAGLIEPVEHYVWENLSAKTLELGAAKTFDKAKIKHSLREYAIAGTLHLDHFAGLRHSKTAIPILKRSAFQLSLALKIPPEEVESQQERLLHQHEKEWKNFMDTLGSNSFIKQWVESVL